MTRPSYSFLAVGYLLFVLATEATAQQTKIYKVTEHCVTAKVIRILDGDTYEAVIPLFPEPFRTVKLRPKDLDAPELHSKCKDPATHLAEEQYAKEVTDFASGLLLDKVVLVCDMDLGTFSRVMGEIYIIGEEKSLRQSLLDRRYVTPYVKGKEPWCNPELY